MEQGLVSAANTLVAMLQKLGYRPENITIAFSRNFSGKDINHLLDKTTVENAKKR